MNNYEGKYPVYEISAPKLKSNARRIYELCKSSGIEPAGVVKGFSAIPQVAELFVEAGFKTLGDSRMKEIIRLRSSNINALLMLIRIPMQDEIPELVEYADSSLNSELETIRLINEEAGRQGKIHGIILMVDMGDLREGYYDREEVIETARAVEKMENVKLMGIGTNLGCYGSIKPSEKNLGDLCELAGAIEREIGRRLEIISGGASTSLSLLVSGKMPERINHLRIGEAIITAKDFPYLWDIEMPGIYRDPMVLKAQVVEVKKKPSFPIGEIFVDAFGNRPVYTDRGMRKRAILAVGNKDVGDMTKLKPRLEGVEIIGSSSDHLILDIEDHAGDIKVGDVLEFDTFYAAMLFLCSSDCVRKAIIY
ncbi:MAG TPA: alanine/ornithine racemase family PLP-dependent enzyme [Clostridia bacterium]|nr:alanine/ornithine racemase family PLP-dependent enzyme [Clostridia bacterium]